jgi:hypothetical protein
MRGQRGSAAGAREFELDGFMCLQHERGFFQRATRVFRPRVPAGGRRWRGARPGVQVGVRDILFSIRSSCGRLHLLAPQLRVEGSV